MQSTQGGMSNMFERMAVASNCSAFSSSEQGLVSSIGSQNSESCDKCSHLKDCKCELNLYDKVAASIDEK